MIAKVHPNVHDLINADGFGTASKAVVEAGFWDSTAVPNDDGVIPEVKKFTVIVTGNIDVTCSVVVEARTSEEAEEKALDLPDTAYQWDFDAFDVDITDAEVE